MTNHVYFLGNFTFGYSHRENLISPHILDILLHRNNQTQLSVCALEVTNLFLVTWLMLAIWEISPLAPFCAAFYG